MLGRKIRRIKALKKVVAVTLAVPVAVSACAFVASAVEKKKPSCAENDSSGSVRIIDLSTSSLRTCAGNDIVGRGGR